MIAHLRGLQKNYDYVWVYGNRQRVSIKSVESTTMIYTHVLNRGVRGVNSPADRLLWRDLELRKLKCMAAFNCKGGD